MISEPVEKCGRIKARFGPGGPENWPRPENVFGGNETERERVRGREGGRVEDEGPTVIGSAYL